MAQIVASTAAPASNPAKRVKLTGRAFYESIGSPKVIVAPMVDRSEFAWRLLTRSYLDEQRSKELLAYSPMFHARLFKEQAKYRDAHFQPTKESLVSKEKSEATPYLDGHPEIDRPLFVQFCANKPEDFLDAAQYVAPYCDAVDLNLGCPQGIAKSGHYGAFLQEDWDTIHKLIRTLRDELEVPVTAKFRIQETPEKTLEYAKMILDAGASIIAVHGRQRHQKGHNTGLADWSVIRYLRENLPPETVLFANGNILNNNDIEPCLTATGADGVMSAEANLSDPTVFAKPPPQDQSSREYWRDPHNAGTGGYRIDGVFRRYMDIIYRYVLEQEPMIRQPLYLPTDALQDTTNGCAPVSDTRPSNGVKRSIEEGEDEEDDQNDVNNSAKSTKTSKKQKKKHNKSGKDMAAVHNPNLKSMQGHLFQLLRPMLASHTHIRDALARARAGDIQAFEHVLSMVEDAVKEGLNEEYAPLHNLNSKHPNEQNESTLHPTNDVHDTAHGVNCESSDAARERCKRPFWVCQPNVRPLPEEAIKLGAMQLSKKEKEALAQKEMEGRPMAVATLAEGTSQSGVSKSSLSAEEENDKSVSQLVEKELPREEALACG
ncbi:tRNA dihydrouridine synthase [Lithohypha guttulata]|uniref:tRNA dihydrouridine synthase n=1 Tax=Lithohypha guttulata TaxID=1690604 RepID=UPI002DDDE8F5|nr:tRNA dihydrouridine synthase [Lithohypha guttulata]KAK5097613.1 tRNA dihydrouridine synthase [Lithohypha guttulata]